MGYVRFLFFYSLASLMLYHLPLLSFVYEHIELKSFGGFILSLSVLIAFFCINIFFFTLLSFFGMRFTRFVGALFFVANSVALYFANTYNVMFDLSMMGNVWNTNPEEASNLFSFTILLYLVFLGILPALVLYAFKLKEPGFKKKILTAISALFVVLVWGFANSSTWLWFDKYAKYLGAYVMPYSYSINALRYKLRQRQKVVLNLPELKRQNTDTLVVLVIGEAARRANFSLYGYSKKTNPLLEHQELLKLKANSCTTYTSASIECMLSYDGSHGGQRYENLPSYLHRFGVKVIWRSNNWGEPTIKTDVYEKRSIIASRCKKDYKNLNYDEVLLNGLEDGLRKYEGKDTFLVLHQAGSHGPNYSEKYPKEFEFFKPVCESVDLKKCSQDELLNAYDNSLLYTDFVLNSLIEILKKQKRKVLMIYISDHGESLGEYGFYLHGTPKAIAPAYQYEVPLLVWRNELYKKDFDFKNDTKEYSDDFIFHTILGAFEAKSGVYKKEFDIFRKKR